MLLVTIFTVFCLISALITYALGIFVFAKNTSSTVNRLFLAMMLASFYWAVGEFLFWQAGSPEEAVYWLKVSSFWPFVVALAAHFILTFTGSSYAQRKYLPALVLFLYAPAALISLLGITTTTLFEVVYQPGTGFFYQPVPGSPACLAMIAYIAGIMVFATVISFLAWGRAGVEKIRRQYRLVSIGLVSVIVSGFLSGVVLPLYGVHLPNLVFMGIVVFSLLIAYAILRYGLFTLNPATAFPDILRLMPDGLVLVDMDGRIVTTNASAASILSFPEEELPGSSMREFMPGDAYPSLISGITAQGTVPDFEVTLEQQNRKVVSVAGSVVNDTGGEPTGFVLILRDISGRKEAERALQLANEKITLLSRLTRHDIGNLVTALWGYLELLRKNRTSPSGELYLAKSIGLVKKISGQLQTSREMQDSGTTRPVWQPLGPMFEEAIRGLPHEGVTITNRVAPVEIYADPLAVSVMYNLIENSLRHGGTLTYIDISTSEKPGGILVIFVEDDGVGIPEPDKVRIFRDGFGKHTGLGLALSRDILSLTGITIAETGTEEGGARFEITVPRKAWRNIRDGTETQDS